MIKRFQAEFLRVRNELRGKGRTLVVSKECYVFRDCVRERMNVDIKPWPAWRALVVWDGDEDKRRFSPKPRTNIFGHV